MEKDRLEIIIEFLDILDKDFNRNMECIRGFIDNYGEVRVLTEEPPLSLSSSASDYFMFCVTKSYKSLRSADHAIQGGFYEDAMAILRTIYENYLHMAYVRSQPGGIIDVMHKNLAVAAGILEKKLNSKGKAVKGEYIDTRTGETVKHGLSITRIAKGSMYPADGRIHAPLYKFLCEFTHPNIIALGSYMDIDKRSFSYEEKAGFLDPMFLCDYFSIIILHQVLCGSGLYNRDEKKYRRACLAAAKNCKDFFSCGVFSGQDVFRLLQYRLDVILTDAVSDESSNRPPGE